MTSEWERYLCTFSCMWRGLLAVFLAFVYTNEVVVSEYLGWAGAAPRSEPGQVREEAAIRDR